MSQQPIGSNQGINLIKQARVVLTNDLIITLPTVNYVPICPAPGANKVNLYQSAIIKSNIIDTYSGIDADAQAYISYGEDSGGLASAPFGNGVLQIDGETPLQDFLNSLLAASKILAIPPSYKIGSLPANTVELFPTVPSYFPEDILNSPLDLVIYNDSDFEDGNIANTLSITVLYMIFNTVTGLFE